MPEIYGAVPISLFESARYWHVRVYAALSSFQGTDSSCHPSIQKIADRGHVDTRNVYRALEWLIENGWVTKTPVGGHPQYNVHRSPFGNDSHGTIGHGTIGHGNQDRKGVADTVTKDWQPVPDRKEQEKNIEKNNGRFSESEFLAFYDAYPKHANKKATLAKYKTVRKSGTTQEQLLAGAKRFAAYHQAEKTPVNFICAPDVWLNKGKWEDKYGSNWESEGDVN